MANPEFQTKNVVDKSTHALREEKILAFWNEQKIFQKSLDKEAPKGEFTFYDGPPFATGTPHYGHILAGTMKDVIPRYKTMQGYRVRRRWGWDCHGLPVENLIEKELGLKSKKDILEYGIGKFNEAARASVMRYADEWRKIVPRLGRFVDMDNDYRTMDATYTESVWWIFKTLFDKGLVYEGFKSMNLCPRCETTLSNFEVAQGYKDIADISVFVKFKVVAGQKVSSQDKSDQGKTAQNLGNFTTDENTYMVAWTTTPWTLPGNVVLAVNPDIDYSVIKTAAVKGGDSRATLIVADSRLEHTLGDQKFEILQKVKGSELVGLSYEPLFDYYSKDATLKNRENGWKVYGADFVTTEDGTGIVHIAPAFGSDDYELLQKNNLPFVQHVSPDGTFKKEVIDFAGQQVKPKSTDQDKTAHQKADIEVIKWLAHKEKLFAKEKLTHSYPHCWRCETPLLNYASSSWFVKVTDLKDKLVKENQKVTWVPPEIGEGRFGNWLMGARDWAVSRSRFWGAPIPVWREDTGKIHVIGSVNDLKKYSKANNNYYVIRHGQSESNAQNILSTKFDRPNSLTEKGRQQVLESAKSLKDKKIDLIISSDFVRTKETAYIIADVIGYEKNKIIYDPRIREVDAGIFDQKNIAEYHEFIGSFEGGFKKTPPGGENYLQVKKRVGDFLYDIDSKYKGKTILVVSHETPIWNMFSISAGTSIERPIDIHSSGDYYKNAEARKLDFIPLPHNEDYELDLHRPYIDDIKLETESGAKLTRVPDVFDCWFESGAMPYGEAHYPFATCSDFEPKSGIFSKARGYPADFIAEGLDQTRGWFYSMLVLGVALFGKTPYKKVLVNGLVLAEDGEKMSKSKKNFPDPMDVVNAYGADSMRYYLMSSPVVRSQDLRFSEKGVDEITKKLVNRLLNVVSFYEMYVGSDGDSIETTEKAPFAAAISKNVLDRWIIARLDETIHAVTTGLEAGELDRAARPFMDLVDDLSTWYLRRSRDRFKGDDLKDKKAALDTTKYVLVQITRILAPFMPFLAEDIYLRVVKPDISKDDTSISVHLNSWPSLNKIDTSISESMEQVQRISSQGLEARTSAKINVRQPLAKLTVAEDRGSLTDEMISLIADEVNVKEIVFDSSLAKNSSVILDTVITPALKEEGMVRELIRAIQDLRKTKGLTISDQAALTVETDENGRKFIDKNKSGLMKVTSLKNISYGNIDAQAISLGDFSVKIGL